LVCEIEKWLLRDEKMEGGREGRGQGGE